MPGVFGVNTCIDLGCNAKRTKLVIYIASQCISCAVGGSTIYVGPGRLHCRTDFQNGTLRDRSMEDDASAERNQRVITTIGERGSVQPKIRVGQVEASLFEHGVEGKTQIEANVRRSNYIWLCKPGGRYVQVHIFPRAGELVIERQMKGYIECDSESGFIRGRTSLQIKHYNFVRFRGSQQMPCSSIVLLLGRCYLRKIESSLHSYQDSDFDSRYLVGNQEDT
jgi:hypothetical protein